MVDTGPCAVAGVSGGFSSFASRHSFSAIASAVYRVTGLFVLPQREEYRHLWKNAGNCSLNIDPDVLCDFTNLPFPDNAFSLVVFDPPHLTGAKETAWLVKKYGKAEFHKTAPECLGLSTAVMSK